MILEEIICIPAIQSELKIENPTFSCLLKIYAKGPKYIIFGTHHMTKYKGGFVELLDGMCKLDVINLR
jgi:hypothetical protein